MKTILTGVDPGSSWLGYACLVIDGKDYFANMGVLHVPSRSFATVVDNVVPRGGDLVMEEYRQRPVGHQRYASGATLQLIGAIKYKCETRNIEVLSVPAGDPGDVRKLVIGKYLEHWVPAPRSTEWNHAWSAWRVIGRHLLRRNPSLLSRLLDDKIMKRMEVLDDTRSAHRRDLIAPSARWRAL